MVEELAIIKGVSFGLRDIGRPCLWFETVGEGWGALQVFTNFKQIKEILETADVYSIDELESKPCIIEREGSIVNFVRIAKI